ncbi:MAG TPA: hypothetical protein VK781_14180 [Solirubrobacteraceae bacterium]|jgi:hypothetical protein|nr:hypothetical protein [Solirubrobacteraceae bacterium]
MNDDDKPPRSSLALIGAAPTDMGRHIHEARPQARRSVPSAHFGADLA